MYVGESYRKAHTCAWVHGHEPWVTTPAALTRVDALVPLRRARPREGGEGGDGHLRVWCIYMYVYARSDAPRELHWHLTHKRSVFYIRIHVVDRQTERGGLVCVCAFFFCPGDCGSPHHRRTPTTTTTNDDKRPTHRMTLSAVRLLKKKDQHQETPHARTWLTEACTRPWAMRRSCAKGSPSTASTALCDWGKEGR